MERWDGATYEGFNIGRSDARPMTEVAEFICGVLGKSTDLIEYADPGPLVTPVKNASFDKASPACASRLWRRRTDRRAK